MGEYMAIPSGIVAAAVDGAETSATPKHVAVPPLPDTTTSLLRHGHHRDASATSAVAVAAAAAASVVLFASAFENVQYQRIWTRRRHLENHCISPGVIIACFCLSCTESIASTNTDLPTTLPPKPFQNQCPQSLASSKTLKKSASLYLET